MQAVQAGTSDEGGGAGGQIGRPQGRQLLRGLTHVQVGGKEGERVPVGT